MTYIFRTPTVREGQVATGRLFSRFKLIQGISVLKINGEYYETQYPSEEDVLDAEKFYLGGIIHEVSAAEKADLEAAGYTVETV